VVIAGLENNRLPNVQEIRRKSIIQIIRRAEESDLWRKEEGFKRRTKSRIARRKAEGIR